MLRDDAKQMAISGIAARLSEEDFNMLMHLIDNNILIDPQGEDAQHLRIIREILLLYVHSLHFSLNFFDKVNLDRINDNPLPTAMAA